ncbi:MAG: hypothetical protein ACOZB3_02675 [Calditrichota bacterium]
MSWMRWTLLSISLFLLSAPHGVWGQYILPQDTARIDTTQKVEQPVQEESLAPETIVPPMSVLEDANTWLRRALFRGTLDATHIGAYAQYQITAWREGIGSYGPVLARLTIYYLGSSEWKGRDAEWLQAVYRTMDDVPTTVEYDLIVPSSSKIDEINRLLYRVDHDEIHSTSLAVKEGQLDYDIADQPVLVSEETVHLYADTFNTEKYRGSGFNGAEVVLYKVDKLPPLGFVMMGYGERGMVYTGGGSDATPRMNVPPPPSR